jgi:prepilin-type N-terminal cleavage/methylation domain-containing protein
MQPPSLTTLARKQSGFSMVEVSIAIAILAIALVALLGLLPQGMSNFRKAMDTTVTAQIAQRIMHEVEQSEFNQVIDLTNLPEDTTYRSPYLDLTRNSTLTGVPPMRVCPVGYTFRAPNIAANSATPLPTLRYFDEQGNELIPVDGALSADQLQALVYQVNVRIMPRAQVPTPTETDGSAFAQVTIQIARNPGNATIPISSTPAVGGGATVAVTLATNPDRNLFTPTKGIQIYTYYTLVGSSQGL